MDRKSDYTFVDYEHTWWEGGREGLGILDNVGKQQATGNHHRQQPQAEQEQAGTMAINIGVSLTHSQAENRMSTSMSYQHILSVRSLRLLWRPATYLISRSAKKGSTSENTERLSQH